MTRHSQRESIRRTLIFLQGLHEEFVDAIELKTHEISQHQTRKGTMSLADSKNADEGRRMQAWRRISFQLHQRRSQLKTMKDTLVRQIRDVETALDQMERLYGKPSPYAIPMRADMPYDMDNAVA